MKTRIISAIIAIAIAIPFIWIGKMWFAFGIGIVSLLGFKEVYDLKKSHGNLPLIPCLIAITCMLLLVYTSLNVENVIYGPLYAKLCFTVLGLLIPALVYKNDKYTTNDGFYLIGWTLFLGMAFGSLIEVRSLGIEKFLYLVSIPIFTDTFAMVLGNKLGKHKMCPKISPHKSWEGALCGLIAGTAIPTVLYVVLIPKFKFIVIIETLILSAMGQIGDLIFSKIKRENGIKDFSNLMPGHGGCLDRLDSTLVIFMTYVLLNIIL